MLKLAFVNVFRSNVCVLSPSTFWTNKANVEFSNLKRCVRWNPLTFLILHVFKLCSALTTSLYEMIFSEFHSRHFNTSVTILASFKIYWLFRSFLGFRFKPRFVVSARSKIAPRRCRAVFLGCNGGNDLIARFFVAVQSLEINQKVLLQTSAYWINGETAWNARER